MPRVAISAGHNPDAKGASYMGFNEYDEATEWASMLLEILSDSLEVELVPTGTLKEKVAFINRGSFDMAIELHFNSAVSNGKRVGEGSETLYYPGSVEGEVNATIMQRHLSQVFRPNRGAKAGHYRMDPTKPADYFLRKTNCPALIVEPEFIHREKKIVDNRPLGCDAIRSALRELLG